MFLIGEIIKLCAGGIAGVVYDRQADKRTGKEPAIALQYIVVRKNSGIQGDRNLSEVNPIKAILIGITFLSYFCAEPDILTTFRNFYGILFQIRGIFT